MPTQVQPALGPRVFGMNNNIQNGAVRKASQSRSWLTRIPFDVLVLIFKLVYDALQPTWYLPANGHPFSRTLFPYSCAAVSPLWAHALRTVPAFWTRVPLALDQPPAPLVLAALSLSFPHPLDILVARADSYEDVDVDKYEEYKTAKRNAKVNGQIEADPRERRRMHALLFELLPHQTRWRSLVIHTRHSGSLPVLGGRAPLLADLRMAYDEFDPAPPPLPHAHPLVPTESRSDSNIYSLDTHTPQGLVALLELEHRSASALPQPLDAPLSAPHLELTTPALRALLTAAPLSVTLRSLALSAPSASPVLSVAPAELAAALSALPLRILHLRALRAPEEDTDVPMTESEGEADVRGLHLEELRFRDMGASDVLAYARHLAPSSSPLSLPPSLALTHLCLIRCVLPRLVPVEIHRLSADWVDFVDCKWDEDSMWDWLGVLRGARRVGVYSCTGFDGRGIRAVAQQVREMRREVDEDDEQAEETEEVEMHSDGEEQSDDDIPSAFSTFEYEDAIDTLPVDHTTTSSASYVPPTLENLDLLTLWHTAHFTPADLLALLRALCAAPQELDVRGQQELGLGDEAAMAALCDVCAVVQWGEEVWEAEV